jgi:hypothetical protein
MFKDMPAVVHAMTGVRLADLKKNKDKYINIDKLEALTKIKKDSGDFKSQIFQLTGMTLETMPEVDKNNLNAKFYYGYYDLKDNGDERLYKIGVINDLVCVCFEEVTQIPFEQIRCFEDTETNLSVGFLESIMGLQQEMNFKKNSASEYITHSLHRGYFRSPNS